MPNVYTALRPCISSAADGDSGRRALSSIPLLYRPSSQSTHLSPLNSNNNVVRGIPFKAYKEAASLADPSVSPSLTHVPHTPRIVGLNPNSNGILPPSAEHFTSDTILPCNDSYMGRLVNTRLQILLSLLSRGCCGEPLNACHV